MAKQKLINGTPWHKDRFTRAEGDPKRNIARCKYLRKLEKKDCLKL